LEPDIKEFIQSFFSLGTLTIVGSGLSCAEGMPGMILLAQKLIVEIPKLLKTDNISWNNIKSKLESGLGLEETLLNEKPDPQIEELISNVTSKYLLAEEKNIIRKVITGEKSLRFEKYISKMSVTSSGLPIITTNYDRLIEFACEKNKIYIDTKFLGRYYAHLDSTGTKFSFCKNVKRVKNTYVLNYQKKIKLYKPHGCFSWYLVDDQPISTDIELNLPNLIITPGLNKYRVGYEKPFDLHREGANKEIDSANKIILIGYGFNDDHLETHLNTQISSGKPTLIITYKLSEKALYLVNKYKNVVAVESGRTETDSFLYFNTIKSEIEDIKIWDLNVFLQEVFNER